MPEPTPGTPHLKVVACLGGVSLERGVPPAEIHEYIGDASNVVWVDAQDPGPSELGILSEEFGLHPPSLEAAGQGHRRPKVDEFKGYALLVTYAAVPDPGVGDGGVKTVEVDLFVGRNFVVSVHRGRVPALEDALTRWTRGGPRLREGAGFLVYAVLDALIDSFAPLLADLEDAIEEAEVAVFTRADEEGVRSLLHLKRTLATLRRELQPLRAIFQVLLRRDHPFFPGSTEAYLRDVYDHLLRILDSLEAEREMAASAMDASLAVSSHRLNKTMKTLAVITVAVAVVGSVFGAYGMNFQVIPLATTAWGFWVVAVGTIGSVATTLVLGWWRGFW